jgi:hypothetical protein
MPIAERHQEVEIVRLVRGLRGAVPMQMEVAFRFDYGHIAPWLTWHPYGLSAIAGPDAFELRTPVPMRDAGSERRSWARRESRSVLLSRERRQTSTPRFSTTR